MRISIIGSEGMIGTALRPYLKGHDVQRIDARLYGQPIGGVCVVPIHPHAENLDAIRDYLGLFKPDLVLNLAALAHDPSGQIGPIRMKSANSVMPVIVAKWCLEHKVRFVAISSLSVHANGDYPRSKRNMEHGLYCLGIHQGIDILRFGTIFGIVPDMPPRAMRPHLLLNSMALDGALKGEITVNGCQDRPCTALHDAVSCLLDRLPDQAGGQVLNRYWASADLVCWAMAVARVFQREGYPIRIAPVGEKSKDKRSYFFAPHLNNFPERVIDDTLQALVRYTVVHKYELARWRRTQFKVLYAKVVSQ